MKRLGKIVCPNGNYTDSEGNEKTRWLTVGSALLPEEGSREKLVIKLDALPINAEFDGWLRVYPDDEKDKKKEGKAPSKDFDDDVPF